MTAPLKNASSLDALETLQTRCPWLDMSKPDYVSYHDQEWGIPVHDDKILFEFIVLESAQAGLSWYTILKKRAHYRAAFAQFDPNIVAQFTEIDVEQLMGNSGIVRHRQKIQATIHNAQAFIRIQNQHSSFSHYLWQFVNHSPIDTPRNTMTDYPTRSPESDALAKDLKKNGFKFMGSTTCYAYMQAVGLINDHSTDCICRQNDNSHK